MHHTFFIVSLLVFFGIIGGSLQRSLSLINTDIKEVVELTDKVFALAPNEQKVFMKLKCQIAKQCCSPNTYEKIFSIKHENVSRSTIGEIGTICLNSTVHEVIAKKCPSALNLTPPSSSLSEKIKEKIINNPELMEYAVKVYKHSSMLLKFEKDAHRICNLNELYAFTCFSNEKLRKSCLGKIFQRKIDSRNKNTYPEYIKNLKAAMNDMYQFMKKAAL
jgi:hypothetical protein